MPKDPSYENGGSPISVLEKKGTAIFLKSHFTMGGKKMEADEKQSEDLTLIKETESEDFNDRYDRRKLYLGLRRHLLLILLCALAFGALGSYLTYLFLTTYKAEAVVLFQEDSNKHVQAGAPLTSLTLPTALDMIKLPAHFQAVKSLLGLTLPVKALDGMVDVPIPKNESNLIRIVASGSNPNLVVDIANSLAKVAVKSSQDYNQRQLLLALENYKNQLDATKETLSAQLQDIEEFKKKNQYFEMTAEYSGLLKRMATVQASLQSATLTYSGLLVEYENLKADAARLPDEVLVTAKTSQAEANPMQSRIASLEAALAEARTKYAKGNPKIIALEEELKSALSKAQDKSPKLPEKKVLERNPVKEKLEIDLIHLQGKLLSSQKVMEGLLLQSESLKKEAENLPSLQIAFAKLLQAKQTTEDQLKFLHNAVDTTQLLANIPKGSLELYQLADKAKPWKDAWWVHLIPFITLFIGAGAGIILAFLIEMMDRKIWTPKQVSLAYHLPTLVTMPEISFFSQKNAGEKTLFFIRILAERIEQLEKAKNRKGPLSIAFTSSQHREGKSCFAFNLATYYKKLGKKVLLMDLDPMSNTSTEGLPTPAQSLESYLKDPKNMQDIIAHGNIDRIRLGKPEPGMKELVKSEAMTSLWQHLLTQYDAILIDAPGVIEEDYALNLCLLVEYSLFVIGSSQVDKSAIDESLKELGALGVKPCGIILNRVLPVYIDDHRIKLERKKNRNRILRNLKFWK